MKNGVECYKDFFPYFKALKTNCDLVLKYSKITVCEVTFFHSMAGEMKKPQTPVEAYPKNPSSKTHFKLRN